MAKLAGAIALLLCTNLITEGFAFLVSRNFLTPYQLALCLFLTAIGLLWLCHPLIEDFINYHRDPYHDRLYHPTEHSPKPLSFHLTNLLHSPTIKFYGLSAIAGLLLGLIAP